MILAHIGHVLIDLPLFGGPVFLMGGALWWTVRRENREATVQERGGNVTRPSQ